MVLLAVLACGPDRPGAFDPASFAPPDIVALDLACDVERERWRLDVETTSWSGGGRLFWTPDAGGYLESHYVPSVEAAGDGSADRLRLDLAIVGDFRAAEPNASTALHCFHDPDGLFVLFDAAGERALCHRFGPDPGLWGTGDLPDCTAPEWQP